MLELREIGKSYPLGGEMVEVLHGVSAEIRPGRLVAIVGPSGSGKSTLLNLIGTLDTPSGGRLLFDGREIGDLSQSARADFRAANLGFIFQFFNLLPGLTARQNVELAAAIAGRDRRRARQRAASCSPRSASPTGSTPPPATSAAARCSGSRSPAPWSTNRA